MADQKISGLPADTSLKDTDYVLLNDATGPTTKRTLLGTIRLWLASISAWITAINIDYTSFPGFLAFETNGTTNFNPIVFNSIQWQTGTGYNAATGVYTIQVTGIYSIDASYTVLSNALTIGVLNKNGVAHQRFGRQVVDGNERQPQLAIKLKLNAGDTLSVGGSGSSLEAGWSWFGVQLLFRTA